MKRKQFKPAKNNQDREYTVTIPERSEILAFLEKKGEPCSFKHLSKGLGMESAEEKDAIKNRLRAMQRDGQLIRNRKEGYAPADKVDLLAGRVIAHPDGFGFLALDQGGDDLFLSPKQMRQVLNGDRVLARISGVDHRGRSEGSIVEILERSHRTIVGRYTYDGDFAYVIPENKRIHQDILIPNGQQSLAEEGNIVVVEITRHPDKHSQPVGKVIEVLGTEMAADIAIDVAIRNHDLPFEWPDEVTQQISTISEEVTEEDKQDREDIRHLPLVTIDGEDARDFDDAVFCEPQGNGWRLIVAIADVSHYVLSGSALDDEARERGTSVYFPQRVIPMLPEIISNGLCSLKPQVDRLCMVCEMSIDKTGAIKRSKFYDAVMHSRARLTYNKVSAMLEHADETLIEEYRELFPHLQDLYSLYHLLHEKRKQTGLVEFESSEASFQFNDVGQIASITSFERNHAHRLIEEFMLAANIATADFLLEAQIPAMYRNHEPPKEEKLTDLRALLAELGLQLDGGTEPTVADYARLLERVAERDDKHLIQTVLLRSMQLAVYEATNKGHFGLAFESYAHFTSPIRRYPDLMVHRAIRHMITFYDAESYHYKSEDLQMLSNHCSMTERRAEEASREVVQWYKCEFMRDKVGEIFQGTINSVVSFGLFVELDGVYIEGLIHVTSLPADYYHHDPVGHRLMGERTNRKFQLAGRVTVQVIRVDMESKKIDFELIDAPVIEAPETDGTED